MQINFNVSFWIALLAGLASFLSPCVFSLVPAYIGYLSGRSFSELDVESARKVRLRTFFHGLAFVLGFSVVFVLLGLAMTVVGQLLNQIASIMAKIGGTILIFFGLHMTGLLTIPFLNYDLRVHMNSMKRASFVSSFLLGVFFSAGWSPCVGPTLGLILTMAVNSNSTSQGVFLLSAYALGMAIPFLISALGVGWVTNFLKRYSKLLHIIEIVMGIILIILGVLLFLGLYQQLVNFGPLIDFGI